ncbi:MAG: T9SS type A sorting domain-containing protein [Chitinophagaceae bacterium]
MVKLYAYLKQGVLTSFLLLFLFAASAQDNCPGFPSMRQVKRPNLTIGTYIKGLLEYTPAGYNPAGAQLYPVIIYFHGLAETGSGSSTDLCRILSLNAPAYTENNPFDIPLPERIERGELPTVTYNSTTYNYIVLSVQYNQYNYPSAYPSAPDVNAMINYALANYKIDPGRVYLTGMSSGANMVMEFAASSQANARRSAGIALASLCSSVGNFPQGPANIANADLPVWAVHCINDDFPGPPGCPDTLVNNWINKINTHVPPPSPLAKKTTLPTAGYTCNTGFTHNTWNLLYDPTFVIDGRNIYNWFIQYSRTGAGALPASLKNYTAVLRGSKVYVEWVTTAENNTARFALERANSNMQYIEVAGVAAAGASAIDKKYALIDDQPAKGVNLYRLVLTNLDGKKEYFEVKRITLPDAGKAGYVNIPGPVRGTMSVYVNVERSQNVRIDLHDINGKTIQRINKLFTPGLSENRLDVSALPSGTYFVKVEGEGFSVTKKVLIN